MKYLPKESKTEVIQSYIITTARYDFNVYEKRVLFAIIDMVQFLLSGQKLNGQFKLQKELFDLYDVEMPIAAMLHGEDDKNYGRIKNALESLQHKVIEYEDDEEWIAMPIIGFPKIKKHASVVQFRLHEYIYDALFNFSKGFKKYELQTVMSFESTYAMRFYELFSQQTTPLNYSIEALKKMFGVEGKYKNVNDFIKRVIIAAKKELDAKSPYSFEFNPMKTGPRFTSIRFYPVKTMNKAGDTAERHELSLQLSPSMVLQRATLDYLKNNYGMSTPEIRNNLLLFLEAEKDMPDLLHKLSEIKAASRKAKAKNVKGYLVNALRKALKKPVEKKPKK
jgi:plasmid replication initiation protein